MDIRVVIELLAKNLSSAGLILLLPLACALYYGESLWPFLMGLAVCYAVSGLFYRIGRKNKYSISARESVAVTALFWIIACLIFSIPFMASGRLGPLDSLVESVSGLTGTGLTVIPEIHTMPKSILLFRSLSHWFGGLGIIVIFVAIFPQAGSSTSRLIRAEISGPTITKTLPRIKDIAKGLFAVYTFFTLVLILILSLLGLPFFEALNQGLSCIATGGFCTWDDSIGHYPGHVIPYVLVVFMIISSINYDLYIAAWHKGFKMLLHDSEARTFLCLILGGTALITLNLVLNTGISPGEAFREALFQSTSAASTTGFSITDYTLWPAFSQFILLILLIIGGCGGSTSGGIKVLRIMILFKSFYNLLKQQLHPREVIHFTNNNQTISTETRNKVLCFFFIYMFLAALGAGALMFDGLSFTTALGAAFATLSNEGVAFGILGPAYTYSALPPFSKCVICISMLLGRLETLTLVTIFMPGFWKRSGW